MILNKKEVLIFVKKQFEEKVLFIDKFRFRWDKISSSVKLRFDSMKKVDGKI